MSIIEVVIHSIILYHLSLGRIKCSIKDTRFYSPEFFFSNQGTHVPRDFIIFHPEGGTHVMEKEDC